MSNEKEKARPEDIALHFFKADYHMTSVELAKLCGVDFYTVSRWCNNGFDKDGLRIFNLFCGALSREVAEMEKNGRPTNLSKAFTPQEEKRIRKMAEISYRNRKVLLDKIARHEREQAELNEQARE